MFRARGFPVLLAGLVCLLAAGCEKHVLEKELSLADAAKLLIEESSEGRGCLGGNLVLSDTTTTNLSAGASAVARWVATWDFRAHNYSIRFDSMTYQGVLYNQTARMTILDSVTARLTLLVDADSVIEKKSHATTRSDALLVRMGAYGYAYHGWMLKEVGHRYFRGPASKAPSLTMVKVERGLDSWTLSASRIPIDSLPRLAPSDLVTVRVRTADPANKLFLNVRDGGSRRRIAMTYHAQGNEYVAQWRVSPSAVSGTFYQAFIEAYSKVSFTSPDSTAMGIAGQSIVYRIK